jgi:predicted molibdopterin-dependent oxidoreductase YjgC
MSKVEILIDGRRMTVPVGTTVAAAILQNGRKNFRTSVSGEPRAALCGMGICYECRVNINGKAHARSCQICCEAGMSIVTG